MLLETLKTLVTAEQFAYITDELGVEDDSDVKLLTLARLMKAGLKEIKAEKVLTALGIAPVVTEQKLVVTIDKGDVAVASMENPEDLLAVLAATGRSLFDKKAAAGKLAAMGRSVVVKKSARKELLATDTVTFWQRGSLRAKFWGRDENPVVHAPSLFETNEQVEIDPYELVNGRRLVALDSGYNAESGADWANVTMPRRALLIAAALDGETVARGDSVAIAETLSSETLSGKWKVLESRADAERLTELQRHLRVPLIDIDTPDSVGGRTILVAIFGRSTQDRRPGSNPASHVLTTTAEAALADLLLSTHSSDELRRFLRYGPEGGEVERSLPGATASPASLATAAVEAYKSRGLINTELFARLQNEKPRRGADILRVRQLVLGS